MLVCRISKVLIGSCDFSVGFFHQPCNDILDTHPDKPVVDSLMLLCSFIQLLVLAQQDFGVSLLIFPRVLRSESSEINGRKGKNIKGRMILKIRTAIRGFERKVTTSMLQAIVPVGGNTRVARKNAKS